MEHYGSLPESRVHQKKLFTSSQKLCLKEASIINYHGSLGSFRFQFPFVPLRKVAAFWLIQKQNCNFFVPDRTQPFLGLPAARQILFQYQHHSCPQLYAFQLHTLALYVLKAFSPTDNSSPTIRISWYFQKVSSLSCIGYTFQFWNMF